MSADNIDSTKVVRYFIIGSPVTQPQVTKVVRYFIIDPTGAGPAANRRASVRAQRRPIFAE